MELSNLYDHAWLNGSNEYVMSDDPNFNPNGNLSGSWNQLQAVRLHREWRVVRSARIRARGTKGVLPLAPQNSLFVPRSCPTRGLSPLMSRLSPIMKYGLRHNWRCDMVRERSLWERLPLQPRLHLSLTIHKGGAIPNCNSRTTHRHNAPELQLLGLIRIQQRHDHPGRRGTMQIRPRL